MGCVSQDSHPRKSIQRKEGKLGSNHTVKFSKGAWHHIKIGKERVHREASFKSANLTNAIRALPDLRKGHKTKPRTKKDASAEWHETWRKMSTSSKIRTKLRFSIRLKPGQSRRPLQNLQRNGNSRSTPEHLCTC